MSPHDTTAPTRICDHCGIPFTIRKGWFSFFHNAPQRFCSEACSQAARRSDPAQVLWSRADMSGDCWIWTGPTTPNGYGRTSFGGRKEYAHRAAWILIYGSIPENMLVCHICDNRLCIRPDHLFLGTNDDNNKD